MLVIKIRNWWKMPQQLCYKPDEIDNELRTVVIAIELISQSGDHILIRPLEYYSHHREYKIDSVLFIIYYVFSIE